MKEVCWRNTAQQMQMAADTHNMKSFYEALKAAYGPKSKGASPLLSADGSNLLTYHEDILNRWETAEEIKKAIKQTSSGKAPGQDGIPEVQKMEFRWNSKSPEIYKCGGNILVRKLMDLFCAIWSCENVPLQYKDASIVHFYKNKGKKSECDNHRGISLLSIAGKILARIILNRINEHSLPPQV